MNIKLTPKQIISWLSIIVLVLIVGHIICQAVRLYFGQTYGLVLFDLDEEKNIPTLYASISLVLCSVLLLTIAIGKRRIRKSDTLYWLGLAAIFLFLAIDEFAGIHEKFNDPLKSLFDTSFVFGYAWVVPYAIFVSIFVLGYLKFSLTLPRQTFLLFLLSGSIYVLGAIGLEILGNYQFSQYGNRTNIPYIILASIEEIMEMVGILIFLYALLTYISTELQGVKVVLPSKALSLPTAEQQSGSIKPSAQIDRVGAAE